MEISTSTLCQRVANYSTEQLLENVSPSLWVDTVNGNIDRYVERNFYSVLKNIPPKYWKRRQQKKILSIFDRKMDFRPADHQERIEGFSYKFIFLNEAGIILRDEYLFHNTIQPMKLDYNPAGMKNLLITIVMAGLNGSIPQRAIPSNTAQRRKIWIQQQKNTDNFPEIYPGMVVVLQFYWYFGNNITMLGRISQQFYVKGKSIDS